MCPIKASPEHLSASLHAVYQRYKAGTSILVKWLASNGHTGAKKNASLPARLPVRDILSLARDISRRAIQPPNKIRDAFQVALVNRRRLTKYYDELPDQDQATADATERHKHFNETLAQAFDVLFPRQKPRTARTKAQNAEASAEASAHTCANHFDLLSDLIEEEPNFDDSTFFLSNDTPNVAQPPAIEDDPLEDIITVRLYVLEIESVLARVNDLWASLTNGTMSMSFAGCLTNFAFFQIRYLVALYNPRFPIHQNLVDEVLVHDSQMEAGLKADTVAVDLVGFAKDSIEDFFLTKNMGLKWPMLALPALKKLQFDKDFLSIIETKSLNQFFRSPIDEQRARNQWISDCHQVLRPYGLVDEEIPPEYYGAIFAEACKYLEGQLSFVKSIVRSILQVSRSAHLRGTNFLFYQLLRSQPLSTGILFQQKHTIPICEEVEAYLGHPETPIVSNLVIGINMLFESSRAFLWAYDGAEANQDNCRLKALRLANEVRTGIDELVEAEADPFFNWLHKDTPLGGIFANLSDLLKRFTSDRRFDLYHQTPWVASSQMCAILGNAQITGLLLLNDGGVFGAALHMYNMLRQLDVMTSMPVLEGLCDLMVSEVFLGVRPTKNFRAVHHRFLGGKYQFMDKRGFLAPPKPRKNGHSPFSNRIDPLRTSFFAHQVLHMHRGDDLFWSRVLHGDTSQRSHNKMRYHDSAEQLFATHSLTEIFDKLQRVLEPEFVGELPMAKINYFKVFKLCLNIWKNVTERYCAPGGIPKELLHHSVSHNVHDPHLMSGMALFDITSLDIDQRMKDKKLAAKIKKHSALNLLREAVVGACDGLNSEDFLWKGI